MNRLFSVAFLWLACLNAQVEGVKVIEKRLGRTYYREDAVVRAGQIRLPEIETYLRQKVQDHPDRDLVMIWFFPDDREWFEYRPIHISYKGIVALWKNARTPPPPMAEAVFYRGAYRIRVRMVTGRVESKEAEFAVFKVGHKEARLVLNRYWLPKDLFHDGMNECLDIFLTSKDQWEKSDIVVLFKEIAERFPSDFVNLEIRRSPWFPDLGRFPLWFPFVDDKFEPPMERDHKVGGIRCEGTPDGVNCQGIP